MPLPADRETYIRFWHANGGFRGAKPVRPGAASEWQPGKPVHWQEQSLFVQVKCVLIRITAIIHFIVGVGYLQHRARKTIGVFESSRYPAWLALQIAFFCYECFVTVFGLMQLPEHWNVVRRNCVDFSCIPAHLFAPSFCRPTGVSIPQELNHYPSIDVIIPCYKEEVHLVRLVVTAALAIDYPSQLISVYLCDDGKDPQKMHMVRTLQRTHSNVHYITRPNNACAKPGNVNYTLERTSSDFVVQLDADFVARPQLVQRLLPYFFVWNELTGLYEFNFTVGVVQTPQHYRNLSPHDQDLFDQRIIFFNNMTLPGKDWFNTSTMVGTANLINREALNAAGNFPYHSFGDDTALSVIFHGLGYRTYFVNESLATGLCPVSFRGNLAQRARWYVTDSQIFFSRHGALTQKGLSFLQRVVYLNMVLHRFYAIFNIFVDIVIILVLTTGFSVVDVKDPKTFLPYLFVQLAFGIVYRIILCLGIPGLFKSTAAHEVFETIFKYSTMKGVFLSLFNRKKLRWKVAEKVSNPSSAQRNENSGSSEERGPTENAINPSPSAVLTAAPVGENNEDRITTQTPATALPQSGENGQGNATVVVELPKIEQQAQKSLEQDGSPQNNKKGVIRKPKTSQTAPNKTQVEAPALEGMPYFKFVFKNLKRCWYNIIMVIAFSFSLIWAIAVPARTERTNGVFLQNGVRGRLEYNNFIPLALAFGFALSYLLAHILVISVCFKRVYVTPWVMQDLQNGRCDQYTVKSNGTDLYVPKSVISLFSIVRMLILLASLVTVIVFSVSINGKFVPIKIDSISHKS